MRGPRGKSSWSTQNTSRPTPWQRTSESSWQGRTGDQRTTWMGQSPDKGGNDPAAVGVGTDASHPLRYTPRRAAVASSPLKRLQCVRPHASVIASNRSRKGDFVLCPPGTGSFWELFYALTLGQRRRARVLRRAGPSPASCSLPALGHRPTRRFSVRFPGRSF